LKPLSNRCLGIIIKINLTTNYQLLLNCNKVHRARQARDKNETVRELPFFIRMKHASRTVLSATASSAAALAFTETRRKMACNDNKIGPTTEPKKERTKQIIDIVNMSHPTKKPKNIVSQSLRTYMYVLYDDEVHHRVT
jgi:hypothetical protein